MVLQSLGAQTDGQAVVVTWKTGNEVNNLGFHVYREEHGRLVRVTKEVLPGSALQTGTVALASGHSYSFVDPTKHEEPGTRNYYVEDIDLNGTKTLHGPVVPVVTERPLASAQGRTLSGLRGEAAKREKRPPAVLKGRTSAASGRHTQPFPYALSSPEETQQALAASAAIKVYVQEDGWYRVALSDLAQAGMDVGTPRLLALYHEGKEVPLLVRDGALEFYGRRIESPFTDTTVYWLVNGSKPGKRIQQVRGRSASGTQDYFAHTETLTERSIYFAALKNGDTENFFGSVVGSEPVETTLTVTHWAGGDARIEVTLQGVTTREHAVSVQLNGQMLGSLTFSGQVQGIASFVIPEASLTEGPNTLTLTASGELDVSMLDTIRLTYWKTYSAEHNSLACTAQGGKEVTITGFSTDQVRVFDVTDPQAVQEVAGAVHPDGGGYAITIGVPGSRERTLIAFTDSALSTPAGMVQNIPSSWYASTGADLVIIHHADFVSSLAPLKTLREQEGLSVAIVDIEDVYDEYAYGMKSPYALKEFLQRARSWPTPPRYVLLVGDASSDPKNHTGLAVEDFVPTKLVDATYLETASDDWFVDGDGDLLPDIPIGRLPVRTEQDAASVVAKLTGYAQTQQSTTALFVADEPKEEDLFDFAEASEAVKALLPPSLTAQTFYRGTAPDADLKTNFMTALAQGPFLVNYVGHGSVQVWRGDIFTTTDAEALTNGLRLPILVAMTCLNGVFQDNYSESMAEVLLRNPDGGAIAVWASSGLTEPYGQSIMHREFIRSLLGTNPTRLGDAIIPAKGAMADPDIRKTWVLIGDPSMRIQAP